MFDLGKWYPELGDYESWRARKLDDFQKTYVMEEFETFDTYTGGIHLFAKGYRKNNPHP